MREKAIAFDGEVEIIRCFIVPALEGLLILKSVKCRVDFDGVELRAVVTQPILALDACIKEFFPVLVVPSTGTDKDL